MHSHPTDVIDVVVIGGGQAGLAMSRALAERGLDHVVLERGRIGQRWRTERWDSLRLLTPAWQARLPGLPDGAGSTDEDRDRFLSMDQVTAFLERYASSNALPVRERTTVRRVATCGDGFSVDTDRGTWLARSVVVATGACDVPWRPAVSADVPDDVHQLAPTDYRNPDGLPAGGVLVVGAGASGVQLADELAAGGRRVHLAAGDHTRVPRRYRGRDIQCWLDEIGLWREDTGRSARARTAPSLQLVGTPDHRDVDLGVLRERGVSLSGRLVGMQGHVAHFDASLRQAVAASERRLHRLLDRIDAHVERTGVEAAAPDRPAPLAITAGRGRLDLRAEGITTILWATGFRREYPWLDVPVLDDCGEIRHHRGRTAVPGLLALGLPGQMRRNSTFLDGVGADAEELARHLTTRTGRPTRPVTAA